MVLFIFGQILFLVNYCIARRLVLKSGLISSRFRQTIRRKIAIVFGLITIAFGICWLIFFGYWIINAFNNKAVVSQEKGLKRFIYYWLPIFFASYLMGPGSWLPDGILRKQFVSHTMMTSLIGLTLCVAGLILACWSRSILGTNWSGSIQKKEDHELISRGPYKHIRHPIYTGILLMFVGSAINYTEYRGLTAVLIVFLCFWFKLKKEEKLMAEVFGEKYLKYKRETKALIPGLL